LIRIGITWLLTGGGESTVSMKNFNLRSNQVRKGGNIGLNLSLIYIHPFLPLSTKFLLFAALKPSITKIFLDKKNIGEPFAPFGPA
jgi:hypothetical protein